MIQVMALGSGVCGSQWNHDFPRLARDAGFSFDTRRSKVITNWNDIKVIDVERIIRERDFTTVDEHLTQVLDCQLEKEFDVRILDSGFVKLFRLAQLSVEYLVQCRRLLDTSVASLRGQLKDMAEEIEYLKKILRGKEEEIRKLKNRTKKHQRAMDYVKTSDITDILRKMVMSDGLSARSVTDDPILEAFHKCRYCDKIFLNQFYLHSHLSRRHPNKQFEKHLETSNTPEASPIHESKYKAETERLLQEIKELKDRVNATEKKLNTNDVVDNDSVMFRNGHGSDEGKDREIKEDKLEMDSMEKETVAKMIFEKWKKEEEVKFREQLDSMKKQLENVIKESSKQREEKSLVDNQDMVKMNEILKQQENEMKLLKEQLQIKVSQDTDEMKRKLENQEQVWQKKMRDTEEEHKKRMEEVNKNMSSLISDAKLLQKQYMNRIELLETDAAMQKGILEEQNKKLTIVQQERLARESPGLRSPERRNFEELKKSRVGESTETLPPYDEGSLESILKANLHQDTNKTSQITVKNVSTTDESILSNNANLSKPNVKTASPKITKHIGARQQSESSEEDQIPPKNDKHIKKTLFPEGKSSNRTKQKDLGVKQLLSPVKNGLNVNVSLKKMIVDEDVGSSSDDSGLYERDDRIKISTSHKSFQRNNMNRESQRERVLGAVRGDLLLIVNKRLQQMGVTRNSKGLSKDEYEKNLAAVKHREQLFAKKHDNYNKIKKKIATLCEEKAKELKKHRSPTINKEKSKSNISLNKVGSMLSSVKNKALSKIKGIKKTANETKILSKPKQPQNVSNARSPVKNGNSNVKPKVTSASIMSMANDLNTFKINNKQQSLELNSTDSKTESSSESSDDDESEPGHRQIVTTALTHLPSTSVENLLNSPIRKPMPSNKDNDAGSFVSSTPTKKIDTEAYNFGDLSDVDDRKNVANKITKSEENIQSMYAGATSTSEDLSEYEEKIDVRKAVSEENISSTKAQSSSQKGVLKNTVSTSALAKKKVLFDLDANQVKSRSTSPSVSGAIEVKTKEDWEQRANEDTDESDSDWNLSNDEMKNSLSNSTSLYKLPTEELKLSTKQSPKIAEISKTIGQQLGARSVKPPAGSVDTLFKSQTTVNNNNSPKRVNVYGGSTTSIASSTFDSVHPGVSMINQPVPKPRSAPLIVKDKLESDLELSDWSIEDLLAK